MMQVTLIQLITATHRKCREATPVKTYNLNPSLTISCRILLMTHIFFSLKGRSYCCFLFGYGIKGGQGIYVLIVTNQFTSRHCAWREKRWDCSNNHEIRHSSKMMSIPILRSKPEGNCCKYYESLGDIIFSWNEKWKIIRCFFPYVCGFII